MSNKLYRVLLIFISISIVVFAFTAAAEGADSLTHAEYSDPVERYGHFAPGRPHEYSRLTAMSEAGRSYSLWLPENEVFEDVEPRLVTMTADGPGQILAIVSRRDSGARLALIGLDAGRLQFVAQSAAIGTPMRWLNPVGAADLDGDGEAEIAAVITPHIGGTLKVYRRTGSHLTEIAALSGFSNHVYGSPELRLSLFVWLDGRLRLLVPDAARRSLRIIAFMANRLFETGHCDLQAPLIGAIRPVAPSRVSAELSPGQQIIDLTPCLNL